MFKMFAIKKDKNKYVITDKENFYLEEIKALKKEIHDLKSLTYQLREERINAVRKYNSLYSDYSSAHNRWTRKNERLYQELVKLKNSSKPNRHVY